MAVIFSDDWTGTNDDPWDSGKWTTGVFGSSGLGVVDIQSNRGRLFHGNASNERSRALASLASSATDAEVLVKSQLSEVGTSTYYIWLRGSGDWVDDGGNAYKPNNGYGLRLPTGELIRVSSGTETVLQTVAFSDNTVIRWVRFRVEGDQLTATVWTDGDSEPAPQFSRTDSVISGPGRLQVTTRRGGGTNAAGVFLDDLTVTDLADASVFFGLTDLPADFGNAETAEIVVRTRGVDIGATPIKLYAQLFQSDETTPLSDEVLCREETADTAFANFTVAFTGLNTTADKAVWDAARVRFRWSSV
jgi:hypothetical protein